MGAGGAWIVRQWRLIDEREQRLPATFDGRLAGFLLLSAVLLVLLRTYGLTGWITKVDGARDLFARWPHPDLWPHIYWVLCRLVAYVVVPAAYVALVWRERLSGFGVRLEGNARILGSYALLTAAVMPLVALAARDPAFQAKYPFYSGAGNSVEEFLAWEVGYMMQFVALEFFFRGVLLFSLARRFGSNAIFLAVIPYAMIHIGKPLPEALGSVVAGVVLGTMALRTRSILGGVVVHCAVGLSMDVLAM